MFPTMSYDLAKIMKLEAQNVSDVTGKSLSDISAKNGQLTPDSIRLTSQYQKIQKEFNNAFAYERRVNAWFTKTYKKEYAAERKLKYDSKTNVV